MPHGRAYYFKVHRDQAANTRPSLNAPSVEARHFLFRNIESKMLVEDSNVPSASIDAGPKASEVTDASRADTRHADAPSLAVFGTEPQRILCGGGPPLLLGPAVRMAQHSKGKDKVWTATIEKKRPLQLLDLPVDVLKEIIKEVETLNCRMYFDH